MAEQNYLEWLAGGRTTTWWHDSADPAELALGKSWGATGVTTNPVLAGAACRADPAFWRDRVGALDPSLSPAERAEKVMRAVVQHAAAAFRPLHMESGGERGWVCAQVNPALCAQRDAMLAMAQRFASWAPNISVKLPATAAGMSVLEECAAQGASVTSTVSFTVSQVVAAAEAYQRGRARAEKAGRAPAPCFAVIMVGRVDDYLREVVDDNRTDVQAQDIGLAGLAIVKRAYGIFRQRGYRARLLVAALRGVHHMVGLYGGDIVMSIHPSIQKPLIAPGVPRTAGIDTPVPADCVDRLLRIPDFRRAYEPDGLVETEFIGYGLTQKTLSQFVTGGWSILEGFR
jgi:transaldolase